MLPFVDVSRIPFFAGLPERDLRAVESAARLARYRRGACLVRVGEPSTHVAIVLNGFVRLTRCQPDGSVVTAALIRSGDLVGVAALRGAAVHDGHAEALTNVRVVEIPIAVMLTGGSCSPRLLCRLTEGLAMQIERAYAPLVRHDHAPVSERLLHLLRSLARPASAEIVGEAATIRTVMPWLSHGDLAALIDADRATVTRALHTLAARGLVRIERGHVVGVAAGDASPGEGERREAER